MRVLEHIVVFRVPSVIETHESYSHVHVVRAERGSFVMCGIRVHVSCFIDWLDILVHVCLRWSPLLFASITRDAPGLHRVVYSRSVDCDVNS